MPLDPVAPFLALARLHNNIDRLKARVSAFDRASTKALQDYRVEQARRWGGVQETKKIVEKRGFVWGKLRPGVEEEWWWSLEDQAWFWEREVRRAELRAERVMEGIGFLDEGEE